MNSEAIARVERALVSQNLDPRIAGAGYRAPHPLPVALLLGAEHGLRPFPGVRETKKPAIGKFQFRASSSPQVIASWHVRKRNPGWLILTGRDGGVVIIDVDGEEGRASLAKAESVLGTLPRNTWRVRSGRPDGGEHIWLRPPPGSDDRMNQQGLPGYPKIDVRGWHGYAVIPGNLHSYGPRYQWSPGCAPGEVELAECPAAWWEFLPKKDLDGETSERPRTSSPVSRGPRVKREHDPASLLIGDGPGFGGFDKPIYKNAIRYFFMSGVDAPDEPIMSALRMMIDTAPKGPGRDVRRYMSGPDLPRAIERARAFVMQCEENDQSNY